jgi:hypothetical protein
VKWLTYILRLAALAAGSLHPVTSVFAGPQIEISFEADETDSQKLVHAQAVFPSDPSVVFDIFNAITAYPMLHDWIRETRLVSAGKHTQEFQVEFAFPWPVGHQWSRVEVRRDHNAIFWRQVEGSLKANHGRISFTTAGNQVHLDYRAAIDIGLPELWTQSYKKKFVKEFLTAAYEQVQTAGPAATLALATAKP